MGTNMLMVTSFLILGQVVAFGQKFSGNGTWHILNFERCAGHERYPLKMDISRKRINRTHDGLDFSFKVPYVINDAEVKMVVCKFMDGGCKPYQVFGDMSAAHLAKKYAVENIKTLFSMAGMDPPGFPLTPGDYEVKQYMLDYGDLPNDGLYGKYDVQFYMNQNLRTIACTRFQVEYEESD